MRKTLWIAIFTAALAGSIAAASAQEVLSANTIGYIKRELPAGGKLITVSVPLDNMTAANNVFSNLSLAAEAPVNSVVSFWDVNGQRWSGGTKGTKGWPANVVTQIVDSGEFFFIKGPATSTLPTEVTIVGEVPADAMLVRAFTGGNNMDALANAYPSDFVFSNSTLAARATTNSVVSFWDANGQRWVGGTKGTKGWPANVVTQKINATVGFFMKEAGSVTTWTNTKPYTWP